MAYDKGKIYQQAIREIKRNKLFFIEDVVAMLPIRKSTFYEYFPINSDEMNAIKEMLEENKVEIKVGIRQKLYKGDKAAELIALYKLICTDEERRALSMQQIEHSGRMQNINVNVTSEESAKKLKEYLDSDTDGNTESD